MNRVPEKVSAVNVYFITDEWESYRHVIPRMMLNAHMIVQSGAL